MTRNPSDDQLARNVDDLATPNETALRLGEVLAAKNVRIVFAESCTCGMIAALLGQVPGISNWFCGSAVTYRIASKTAWLGVSPQTIKTHTAESIQTTMEMAKGLLDKTPEANLAIAITGHFGPGAPINSDGVVYVSVHDRQRNENLNESQNASFRLKSQSRISRQLEAAERVLTYVAEYLGAPLETTESTDA